MGERAGVRSDGDEASRVSDRFDESREQDTFVVAITGTIGKGFIGRLHGLYAAHIAHVFHPITDPSMQPCQLARPVFLGAAADYAFGQVTDARMLAPIARNLAHHVKGLPGSAGLAVRQRLERVGRLAVS